MGSAGANISQRLIFAKAALVDWRVAKLRPICLRSPPIDLGQIWANTRSIWPWQAAEHDRVGSGVQIDNLSRTSAIWARGFGFRPGQGRATGSPPAFGRRLNPSPGVLFDNRVSAPRSLRTSAQIVNLDTEPLGHSAAFGPNRSSSVQICPRRWWRFGKLALIWLTSVLAFARTDRFADQIAGSAARCLGRLRRSTRGLRFDPLAAGWGSLRSPGSLPA